MQPSPKLVYFIIILAFLRRNLIIKASSKDIHLNTSTQSKEILEEDQYNDEKNKKDELTRYYNDIFVLIKNKPYYKLVTNFITNFNGKIEELCNKTCKTEEILDYSIACLKKITRILNYTKSNDYNIDDRIVIFFKNVTFTNNEFYNLNHLLLSYDSIFLAEIKALDLIAVNSGKEEEIFAKMDALTDSDRLVINIRFLIISLSDKCTAMKPNLEKINQKNIDDLNSLCDYFVEMSMFLTTTINNHLKGLKNQKMEFRIK